MRRRHTGFVAIVFALAGTLVGCGGVVPDLPAGLSVVVYQPRPDIVLEQFALQIVNDGDGDAEIISASLSSPDFVDDVVWTGSSTVLAGHKLDLRVPLPQIACSGEIDPRAFLSVEVGSLSERTEVNVTDPYDLLPRLHREACLGEEIAEIATLTPREVIQPDGVAPAILVIAVEPTGAPGSVTLDAVGGTTLLQPTDGEQANDLVELGITIDATGPFEVRIPFVPNRCDPHALMEDKVGTIIPLYVTTATTNETRWMLPVSDAQRGDFYAFYTAYCGLPAG
jgi:hypothetical protein